MAQPAQHVLSRAKRADRACLTFVAFLVSPLTHGPSPGPALVPVRAPCLATWGPVAHAGPPLAAAAASDAGRPAPPAEEAPGRWRASERLRLLFAAVVRVGLVQRLAGLEMTTGWNRAGPAAGNFFPEALPALPAEKARAHFALAAPGSAAALR